MKQRPRGGKPDVDADGVRIVHHERASLLRSVPLIAAAITVSLAALLLIRTFDRPEHVSESDPTGQASVDSLRAPVPRRADKPTQIDEPTPPKRVRTAVRRRSEASASRNRPQDEGKVATSKKGRREIDARDYIAALREEGETGGVAAFSPPGYASS